MIDINLSVNVNEITKKLNDLARKELPFAIASSLTALAREVQEAEKIGIQGVFEKPRPFTVNSMRVFGATKDRLTAGVFAMDKTANYLAPFETGGDHFMNPGAHWLHVPVAAPKDAGGNMPLHWEAGRANSAAGAGVFFGVINVKGRGPIKGMWQRTVRFEVRDRAGALHTSKTGHLRSGWSYTGRNGKARKIKGLRLLVEYVGNKPVRRDLDFFKRAEQLVNRRFDAVFGRELANAIAKSGLKS